MYRIIMLIVRGIFVIPYWLFLMKKWNKKGDVSIEKRYELINHIANWVMKRSNVDPIVTGLELLPEKSGYMLAPNHQGMFDAFMLLSTHQRPITAVYKHELTTTPIVKDIANTVDAYPMDRENLRASIKVIRQVGEDIANEGRNVVIFPEGTRSRQGNIMGEFKGGSFKAAQIAKAPIVPVAFIDCFKPFDTKSLAKVSPQIHYLQPIEYSEYEDLSTQEIADLVKARIQAKMDEVLK